MPKAPAHVFSCDPGLLSGVAELTYGGGTVEHVYAAERDPQGVCEDLETFINLHSPEDSLVVYERFTITAQTAKNSQAPWSLELIGAAKWIVSSNWGVPFDRSVLLQKPADAKGLVPNDLLRKHGLWFRGGAGHANDALRHGVYLYAKVGVTYFWDE